MKGKTLCVSRRAQYGGVTHNNFMSPNNIWMILRGEESSGNWEKVELWQVSSSSLVLSTAMFHVHGERSEPEVILCKEPVVVDNQQLSSGRPLHSATGNNGPTSNSWFTCKHIQQDCKAPKLTLQSGLSTTLGCLFARRSLRCVQLTPPYWRLRLQEGKHQDWIEEEWGRVLFSNDSRHTLSSDSGHILIFAGGDNTQ